MKKSLVLITVVLFCVIVTGLLSACSYKVNVLIDGAATVEKIKITNNFGGMSKYQMSTPVVEVTEPDTIQRLIAPFIDKSLAPAEWADVSVQQSLSAAFGTNTTSESHVFAFHIEITLAKKFLRRAETYKIYVGEKAYRTNVKTEERTLVYTDGTACYRGTDVIKINVSTPSGSKSAQEWMLDEFDTLFFA